MNNNGVTGWVLCPESKLCLESYINLFQSLGITKLLILCCIIIKLPSFNMQKWYRSFCNVIFRLVIELMFADKLCIFQVENQANLIHEPTLGFRFLLFYCMSVPSRVLNPQ